MTNQKFINSPNFPECRVSRVLIGDIYCSLFNKEFQKAGIETIKIPANYALDHAVRSHADMSVFHSGNQTIITSPEIYENISFLQNDLLWKFIKGKTQLNHAYPGNACYNALLMGKLAFHNIKITDPVIKEVFCFENIRLIHVNQGYARCAVLPVTETAAITSDRGIFQKLLENGIDTLLIRPGFIRVEGYDYGFIGGCGGKISDKTIAFTGDIKYHPDYFRIARFLEEKEIQYVSLKDEVLMDIGSFIPITEYIK